MSGAGLSGYLAEPAGRVPALGDLDLFKRKPYLLPGLTMSFIAIISAFTIWLFVPEVSPGIGTRLTAFRQIQYIRLPMKTRIRPLWGLSFLIGVSPKAVYSDHSLAQTSVSQTQRLQRFRCLII